MEDEVLLWVSLLSFYTAHPSASPISSYVANDGLNQEFYASACHHDLHKFVTGSPYKIRFKTSIRIFIGRVLTIFLF